MWTLVLLYVVRIRLVDASSSHATAHDKGVTRMREVLEVVGLILWKSDVDQINPPWRGKRGRPENSTLFPNFASSCHCVRKKMRRCVSKRRGNAEGMRNWSFGWT